MHLDTGRRHLVHQLRAPGFDHRCQQGEAFAEVVLFLVRVTVSAEVMRVSAVIGKTAHGLGHRLHAHEHALNICMLYKSRRFAGLDITTLYPLLRVGQRILVGAFGKGDALEAYFQPSVVHQCKHAGKTITGFTDQVADGPLVFSETHDTGRARMNAELVFCRYHPDIVSLTQGSVFVDQELGHQEKRQTLVARRCIHHRRQNDVHDVFRHFMLTPGDEDLLAPHQVVVSNRFCPGLERRKIRARMGFRQVHGRTPLARYQRRQILLFDLVTGMSRQRINTTRGQQRTERHGHTGAVPHLGSSKVHQEWQTLPAIFRVLGQTQPFILDKQLVGLDEAVRRHHRIVFNTNTLFIADPIQRCEDLTGKFSRFFQDSFRQFGGCISKTCQAVQPFIVQQFIDNKTHLTGGSKIIGHGAHAAGIDGIREDTCLEQASQTNLP